MTPGPDPEGSDPRAMAATGAAATSEHSRTRVALQPWAAEQQELRYFSCLLGG